MGDPKFDFEDPNIDFGDAQGLNKSKDPKDLPYFWDEGEFKMDHKKLNRKLKKAKLIIGDVSQTVKKFNIENNPAPIGAIFFDLDYYTSTINAFSGMVLLDNLPTKFILLFLTIINPLSKTLPSMVIIFAPLYAIVPSGSSLFIETEIFVSEGMNF